MKTYQIEVGIDDKALNERIIKMLNAELNNCLITNYNGVSMEVSAAVKDLIYSRKDEIIEKVVNRATGEIVKKGLPKLLERMVNNDNT